MNLKEAARQADSSEDFMNRILPAYSKLMVELMDVRSSYLHESSNYFKHFLATEG